MQTNWLQKIAIVGYLAVMWWIFISCGVKAALLTVLVTICACVFIGCEDEEGGDIDNE